MQENTTVTPQEPHRIFDTLFKRLMQLSKSTVIQCINALFGTAYPLDSPMERLTPAHITGELRPWISDIWFVINHTDFFHLKVQRSNDKLMGWRLFNYEYEKASEATLLEDDKTILQFASSLVIYLEPTPADPDQLTVQFLVPHNPALTFTFPTFKLLEYSIGELEERKLNILLPLYLLKLRKPIAEAQSSKRRQELAPELKRLVADITQGIERGTQQGLLNEGDHRKVMGLMGHLYTYLYRSYPEFKEINGMIDGILLTVVDEAELAGRREEKTQIAQNLIQEGLTCELIARTTGLDLSTVESLMRTAQA